MIHFGFDELLVNSNNISQNAAEETWREVSTAAKEVILVADHSKFGKTALAKVCSLEKLHLVITDSKVDDSVLQGFQRINIPIITI